MLKRLSKWLMLSSGFQDCCASLGFTYSRDFDNMLMHYERALQLPACLAYKDLQLIETNIGRDKDRVEYDHTKDPILLPDLKTEL